MFNKYLAAVVAIVSSVFMAATMALAGGSGMFGEAHSDFNSHVKSKAFSTSGITGTGFAENSATNFSGAMHTMKAEAGVTGSNNGLSGNMSFMSTVETISEGKASGSMGGNAFNNASQFGSAKGIADTWGGGDIWGTVGNQNLPQ